MRDKIRSRHFLCESGADLVVGEGDCEFALIVESLTEKEVDEEAENRILTEECGD